MALGKNAPIRGNAPPHQPMDDPHITKWRDEEMEHAPATIGKKDRSLRDWIVLSVGILLLLYVIGYLFAGDDASSSTSGTVSLFGSPNGIAIIPIQGEISSTAGNGSVSYTDVVAALTDADNNPAVSVIFLDIDSSGGAVVPSKQIVAKIREVKKPVISWIGETGASGAYYIASASDYVMADTDSITGSIGVISRIPTAKKLLEELGINVETIRTGDLKAIGSPYEDLSPEGKQVIQSLVLQAFDSFREDVKTFRGEKLDPLLFDEILDGRVVSGKEGLNVGLLDELGTRQAALKKAAELGMIDGEPALIYYLEKEFTWSDLFFSAGEQFGKGLVKGSNAQVSSGSSVSYTK